MSLSKLSRSDLPPLPANFEKTGFDLTQLAHGIVHIGLGGFHRAHMARYTHDLMGRDPDACAWAIAGAGLRVEDRPLLNTLTAQEGLYTLVEREGATENRVLIGSIIEAIDASRSTSELLKRIGDPRTRIVSTTVTESGYHLDRATKTLDFDAPPVVADLAGPTQPRTVPGILVEGLRRRMVSGAAAFTALCCDNIQHNGNILKAAVLAMAGRQDPGLAEWIDRHASFPNSMVDRITPFPTDAEIAALAAETGLDDRASLHAELFRQWVIEDNFVAGRPAWEKVGAQFVDDVTPYEFMKLRLLNASHLAIAAAGQLCGYSLISDTIDDPLIRRYMIALMDKETGPTLMPVPGINLADYKRALVARFANRAIRDTTQRVNTDAPVNYLVDPLRDRLAADAPIELLALALAAWLRRASGWGDDSQRIQVVHPMSDLLARKALEGGKDPRPLLSLTGLFGTLGEDRRLIEAVGYWLALIYGRGMRATIAIGAERGLF